MKNIITFVTEKVKKFKNTQLKNKTMTELVLTKKDAIRLYPSADKTMKEIFEQTFGKETFSQKITDRIKDMSDVYEDLGINEAKFKKDVTYRAEKMAEFAKKVGMEDSDIEEGMPCFLIRDFEVYALVYVLNEGWIPDYTNTNQRRWYPYFSLDSGFDFSSSVIGWSLTYAISGFRLCLKSEELANYAGRTFIKEFKKYTINK
jgi:hypothetical protein